MTRSVLGLPSVVIPDRSQLLVGAAAPVVLPWGPYSQPIGRFLYVRVVKPSLDRFAGAVLLVVLGPAMLAIAALVRVTLGRGVIFRQRRVGLNGTEFTVLKFRTMLPDRREADPSAQLPTGGAERRVTHKTDRDPRHTPLGRVLRNTSLDELPQLFNVIRGEMSLVGPRPELTAIVAQYEPWQRARHLVKPGLTGAWQVAGRGDGPMHEHTDIDVAYVAQISFTVDLAILARTVPALINRTGR